MGSPAAEAPLADPQREHEGFVETARGLWQDERVEIVAAILLALATVLSAWGAYQATRWSGQQADAYAESAALRASASRQAACEAGSVETHWCVPSSSRGPIVRSSHHPPRQAGC